MNRKTILVLLAVVLALLATSCEKLKARDNLNKGVQAFRNARFPEAVERFKEAVRLDPSFATARLYLATAYMSQYIPGAESPDNTRMAQAAYDEFQKVLQQDSKNELAINSIASLYLNQQKWDEAKQWYHKLIEVNPQNKEAYYSLGFIAWKTWYVPWATARAKLGMKPEDTGPIKDKKVKAELREKYVPIVNEGLENLNKALEIDKDYDDAMAYINLLIRERADLDETQEQYNKDIDTANNWVQKALQTKKMKAEKTASGGITQEQKK